MRRLNPNAQAELRAAGISPAEWIRNGATWPPRPWDGGEWRGDECGCDDDRCIGFHHEEHEECGCLSYLIADYRRRQQAEAIWDKYRAAVAANDQARVTAAMDEAEQWVRKHHPNAETFSLEATVNGLPGISIIETHDREPMRVPGYAPTDEPGKYRNLVWLDAREPIEYSTHDWDQ